ncbi:HAD domain-containing protein [Psychroserpens luteus]|uniref:HAD domain-containing protein n=1 Tax=Psychroserpens luteus TaxID=1434066 RepID=UPI001889FDAF|nr:HAD domain-containing protein [Psychroserpens luteus]
MRHNKLLILDLDGVLITNPSWKSDRIDSDGYSEFNESCVENLNQLLTLTEFDIWLSSTRRTVKTLTEFNLIFKNRGINKEIVGFLPEYADCKNRKEEVQKFIAEYKPSDFLIIDDDKSLNGLENGIKEKLILTDLIKGFDLEKLNEVTEKMKNRKTVVTNRFILGNGKDGIYSDLTIEVELSNSAILKRGKTIELKDNKVLNDIESEIKSWINDYKEKGIKLKITILNVGIDSEGRRYQTMNSVRGAMHDALPNIGIEPPQMFSIE